MNIALLQQIKQDILDHPEAFRMDIWSCGTACCIGGKACTLVGDPIADVTLPPNQQRTTAGHWPIARAEEALGLTIKESTLLFYIQEWPLSFWREYQAVDDLYPKPERLMVLTTLARIAAARIDHFIATEGRE